MEFSSQDDPLNKSCSSVSQYAYLNFNYMSQYLQLSSHISLYDLQHFLITMQLTFSEFAYASTDQFTYCVVTPRLGMYTTDLRYFCYATIMYTFKDMYESLS